MGGLALKNCKTRRYERAEFDVISVELMDALKQDFKRVAMPLFYNNKTSFGDADIIVSTEGFNKNMRDYIVDTFSPNEIFHNGNCWSFDYKELQVDLITVAPEHFDSNMTYLSYNDMGNYIGKIAHGFGLKYGQEGLMYDHYFKGSNIGRIILSKDYDKIYKFLGLSYDRWKQGFNDLEDIFKFISESPFFNWEYVQLENNNRVNRERDKKRKSYMSFLDYIEINCKDDNHRYEYLKDKSNYLKSITESFPEADVILNIRELEYNYCKNLYIKAKFSGVDVIRETGAEDKGVGIILNGFKEYIDKELLENYEFFMLTYSREKILENFHNFLIATATNINRKIDVVDVKTEDNRLPPSRATKDSDGYISMSDTVKANVEKTLKFGRNQM